MIMLDRKNSYTYITEASTTSTTTSTSKNPRHFPKTFLTRTCPSTLSQEWAYKTELQIYSTLYQLFTFVFRIISPNTTNWVFQKDFIHDHFKLMGLNVSWLLGLHSVEQLTGMNYRALPGLSITHWFSASLVKLQSFSYPPLSFWRPVWMILPTGTSTSLEQRYCSRSTTSPPFDWITQWKIKTLVR